MDYLTKMFDNVIGAIYTIENVKDGGEEPELKKVFQFIKEQVAKDFGAALEMTMLADAADGFKRPDKAIEAAFAREKNGVLILGFEGYDSHWTVVRGVTRAELILFDSWEYKTFDRRKLVWNKQVKDVSKSNDIVVSPTDLNWVAVRPTAAHVKVA